MRAGISRGITLKAAVVLTALVTGHAAQAAERVQPVPLGGSLPGQKGDKYFGVYVPTRFGGTLTINASSGNVDTIVGPDGRTRRNGDEVGNDQQGWYTFRVTDPKESYSVDTAFVQEAKAAREPWNFYYWPTKSDAIHEPWDGTGDGRANSQAYGDDEQAIPVGWPARPGQDVVRAGANGILESRPAPGDTSTWFPNLYDDLSWLGADNVWYSTPAPMLKYDQLFGTSARMWEASQTQNHDIRRWPGHCLGGAIASIQLNEPRPAPGSGLTVDELKALWAELGENHYNHQIGDNVNNIPAGPPRPGWDPCDAFVSRFHSMLETYVRGKNKSLLANLRGFPPNGTSDEVWNHGVRKYTAKYHAVPGRGERSVRIELEMVCNTGANLNEQDPKPRTNKYEYILVYGTNGQVDESQTALCDWIGLGGEAIWAPLNVMDVVSSRWQGYNPNVSESNLRAVDVANGGSTYGRFAGTPPRFAPVASYEAGRAPMFARGGGIFGRNDSEVANNQPRQGRRFRLFGGR